MNHRFSIKLLFIVIVLIQFSCQNPINSQEAIKDRTYTLQSKWETDRFKKLNSLKPNEQQQQFIDQVVVFKNDKETLPLQANQTVLFIASEGHSASFFKRLNYYTRVQRLTQSHFFEESKKNQVDFKAIQHFVFSFHLNEPLSSELGQVLDLLPSSSKKTAVFFRAAHASIDSMLLSKFDAVIWAHENHYIAQESIAEGLFGTTSFSGQVDNNLIENQSNSKVELVSNGRLGFAYPETFGIPSDSLKTIDRLAQLGISEGAYPGCQVLISVKGKVIYNKSFGSHTYAKDSKKVDEHDLYDLASVTKIAASTLLAMELHSKKQLNLNNTLGYYLDEVKGTPYENVSLKSMMAHQAGFVAWIPFYRNTLSGNDLNGKIYKALPEKDFSMKVAEGIFMKDSYVDSMYKWIYSTPLKSKTYRYSDLCFYFMKKILEKKIGTTLDQYLENGIYKELGLQNMCYNPLRFFDKTQITPTEDDKIYRKQLVHGYVHDQGAAMLGGVGGHAGLFSNAYDLAVVMQLFLNKGTYAGKQYLNTATVDEFTKQQYSNNRRGAGFDRPKSDGGGTCDKSCSQKSFGHSGFTGTLAWADPSNEVVVVFLSNRVYPDAQNWKIVKMNTRTDIQAEINRLLKKYN